MAMTLRAETQRLIEQRRKETGTATPDGLVQVELQTLESVRGQDIEDIDPDTPEAIEQGVAEAETGRTRPWEQVRAELRSRLIRE